jgi:hypothetical protein
MGADGNSSRFKGVKEPGGVGLVHQLPNLIRGEPGDLVGFTGRAWLAAEDAAAEDQGDDAVVDLFQERSRTQRHPRTRGTPPVLG